MNGRCTGLHSVICMEVTVPEKKTIIYWYDVYKKHKIGDEGFLCYTSPSSDVKVFVSVVTLSFTPLSSTPHR